MEITQHRKMKVVGRRLQLRFVIVIVFAQFPPLVKCRGTMFQRLDQNLGGNEDDLAGFFHQCGLDSTCNFVVKRAWDSNLEKRQSEVDVKLFYRVWKKVHFESKLHWHRY